MMSWLARQDGYDPNAFDVPGEQTYDRRLDQTWPGQLAQDAIGAVLAPGRALQSTEPITTEQMIKPAFDLAGLITGGSYAAPAQRGASGAGIRAYHSSPHDFDKFDLARIGTGEGAQVYGHGLYFAENPAVSGQGGQYWQQFLQNFQGSPEGLAARELMKSKFDRALAHQNLQKDIASIEQLGITTPEVDTFKRAQELLHSGKPVGPRTYEVNINADPAHMLDWDKPLSAQGGLREALSQVNVPGVPLVQRLESGRLQPTGNEVYRTLEQSLPGVNTRASASDVLREAGIPGIKYLDQGSRNATPVLKTDRAGNVISSEYPPPTSNYVIFDPNIIDITKKYAVPGAIGVSGMSALAAQDEYRGY